MGMWLFHRMNPSTFAGGDAVRNTFSGRNAAASLARESLQNSVDAATSASEIVNVDFREVQLDYSREPFTQEFWNFLNASPRTNGASGPEAVRNALGLVIEDYGTVGLPGPPSDTESRMFRLMGEVGGTTEHKGQGGAYGFGKAVYILSSQLWTFFAFTVVDGQPLLFGSTFQDPRRDGAVKLNGIGWYCHGSSTPNHPIAIDGEDAIRIAKALRIPRAENLKQGTSLLIPAHTADLDQVKAEICRSWWPRIVEKKLDVTIRKSDGLEIKVDPARDPIAQHYIRLFQQCVSDHRHLTAQDGFKELRIPGNEVAGCIMLGSIAQGESTQPDEDAEEDFRHGIALIRNPRMVVRYYRWGTNKPREGVIGVFVADDKMNQLLQRAEPPAHDDWTRTPRIGPGDWRRVDALRKEIRRYYSEFDKSYIPQISEDDIPALVELKRELGALVFPSGSVKPTPKTEPFRIREQTIRGQVLQDGRLQASASAIVTYTGEEPTQARVRVVCNLTQVGNPGTDDCLAIDVTLRLSPRGPGATQSSPRSWNLPTSTHPEVVLSMQPNDSVEVSCTTEPYSPQYQIRVAFEAEVVRKQA